MIRLTDSVMLSRVDDEIVLLDSASGKYFGFNAVGSRMVDLLITSSNYETTLKRAASEYAVPEKKISDDLRNLFSDLLSKRLIQTDD